MLDGISRSLVNMASKVGKGDLDKGVVFDTQNGKLGSFLWKPFRSLSWNIFSPHEFH